jgi:hypothetical protein
MPKVLPCSSTICSSRRSPIIGAAGCVARQLRARVRETGLRPEGRSSFLLTQMQRFCALRRQPKHARPRAAEGAAIRQLVLAKADKLM